jgi:hypothetical protein
MRRFALTVLLPAVIIIAALFLYAAFEEDRGAPAAGPGKPGALPLVGSAENLKLLLEKASASGLQGAPWFGGAVRGLPEVQASRDGAKTGAVEYSGTNVQVAGVDEADLVKTDGEYIYLVADGQVVIARVHPPEAMAVTSVIKFAGPEFHPLELYLDEAHLVVIGASWGVIPMEGAPQFRKEQNVIIYPPPAIQSGTLKALVYSIADKTGPRLLREVEIEGHYLSSRKIGPDVYLLANKYIHYYGSMVQEWTARPPAFRDTAAGGRFAAAGYDTVRYFPGFVIPNYLTVSSFSLERLAEPVEIHTFLGAGENIYCSTGHLFVAVTGIDSGEPQPASGPRTSIYKFKLDGGKVAYTATGAVPGTVLNQFSMDEHKGFYRVATTGWDSGRGGGGTSQNNLYILDGQLKPAGKIEGLAPGEQVYSARFMGDRGFMVTFRTVDPLFVLDLGDPYHPKVLGELKIPGYSNYLHPYDENYLLGFGKDAVEVPLKDHTGKVIDTFALHLGMKVSLFDITDVRNPVEKHTVTIGARGTHSDLLYNHKVLLFDREKNLLAFPVTVMELKQGGAPPDTYGEFAFQGAYVYDVTLAGGFNLRGRISHLSGPDYPSAGDHWYDGGKEVRRVLYIGDTLFTISPHLIKAHHLSDLRQTGALLLPL